MKILLAPSEAKRLGGVDAPAILCEGVDRQSVLEAYEDALVHHEALTSLFGVQASHHASIIAHYHAGVMCAIERYSGVAFEHLDYMSLSPHAQAYLNEHLILFSNLYGILRPWDMIPYYKLKQGAAIGTLLPQKYYHTHLKAPLDTLLGDEEVIDLRAGFYDAFYAPRGAVMVPKFLKNGKVVSHWAKAYRGILLRAIAQAAPSSIDEVLALEIEGLMFTQMHRRAHGRIDVIYTIQG